MSRSWCPKSQHEAWSWNPTKLLCEPWMPDPRTGTFNPTVGPESHGSACLLDAALHDLPGPNGSSLYAGFSEPWSLDLSPSLGPQTQRVTRNPSRSVPKAPKHMGFVVSVFINFFWGGCLQGWRFRALLLQLGLPAIARSVGLCGYDQPHDLLWQWLPDFGSRHDAVTRPTSLHQQSTNHEAAHPQPRSWDPRVLLFSCLSLLSLSLVPPLEQPYYLELAKIQAQSRDLFSMTDS